MATTVPPRSGPPLRSSTALPPLRRQREERTKTLPTYRLLAGLAFVVGMGFLAYDAATRGRTTVGLLAVPVLFLLLYPVLSRMARRETTFDLLGILYLGFALRIIATYWRLRFAADAKSYHFYGQQLAQSFRELNFFVEPGREVPGTGTVRYISGLVVAGVGSNFYMEFLVFTLFAFTGAILLYRAFVTAFPTGARKRYALLVLLWPSMAYWPSSVGKEALMLFGIGLASWGAARMFTHERGGITALVAGLGLLLLIRPHVALVVVVAVGTAYLFVRSTSGSLFLSGSKIMAILVLLVGGALISTQTAEFLDLENFGSESVDSAFSFVQDRTSQGGAEFSPVRADQNPATFPLAVATVLFRPLPFEAHNTESFLAAAEGAALVALTIASWRRLLRFPKAVLTEPYVAYATAMTLLSCFVFSVISNFGILTRQRTQLLPFYFVLLCIPLASDALRKAKAEPRRRATLLEP